MFEQAVQKQLLPGIIHYHYRISISSNVIFYNTHDDGHNVYLLSPEYRLLHCI